MRLAEFPLDRASLRRARVLILCLLAVSLAIAPASVVAKTPPGGSGRAPSCSSLSRSSIANLVGTGPLTRQETIGNLCEFTGHIPGHYLPMLDIQLEPYFPTVWKAAQGAAMKSAVTQHSTYGRVSSKLFFVSGDKTSKGLPMCEEGNAIIGPVQQVPECAGQPELVHFNVIGYGPYKSGSLQLMVSAAVSAQVGDTHLSRMIALVQRLLSGKIH